MNKIKDIIYDFNDIFVILLIIALTAGVLFWRIDRIMAYPEYLESQKGETLNLDTDLSGLSLKPEAVDKNMNDDPGDIEANWENLSSEEAIEAKESDVGDGTQPQPQGNTQTGEAAQPTEGAVQTGDSQGSTGTDIPGGLPGGKTGEGEYVTFTEVKFTVPKGASGTRVGNLLEEAQLVESKQAFVNALIAAKRENRLQVGTFTIPAGSTVNDIVEILTK
ncbi:MAG: endolytic transglycosylase MltG [Firmicutes bacterium]|nr:endolytic transglycosylase MltG [Bacillota bacterium]